MNDYTIKDIENFSASYIESLNDAEHVEVKGHNVCLVDLGGHWGYSALVTCEGHHIYYANDYELHHSSRSREWMRKWYIDQLNEQLFTDDELRETSDSYDEAERKKYYIRNYYSMRRDHQSIWCYGEPADWYKEEKDTVVYSNVAFAYYHQYDEQFVSHMAELYDACKNANDPLRDYEHAYKAFVSQMFNHEYAISWQGDWDVIRCFANVDGEDAEDMLPKTGWSDEIIRAYKDAARYVMKNTNC